MLAPDRIGHYHVVSELGQGGMGVVYAAYDERLNRPVAIKKIRQSATDELLRERFWREAHAGAAVNHPNVCHLYEVAEHEGDLVIVMELLEGESVRDRLRSGPLPIEEDGADHVASRTKAPRRTETISFSYTLRRPNAT